MQEAISGRLAVKTSRDRGRTAIALNVALAAALVTLCSLRPAESANKRIPTFAGPYIPYVDRFFMCNDTDWSAVGWMRASHFNPAKPYELQRVSGNVTLAIAFDDSMWIKIRLASRSNNQWKDNAFVVDFNEGGCSKYRQHAPDLYWKMLKLVNATDNPKHCTIPQGQYIFENREVDWTFPHFPIAPYGHYRFILTTGYQRSTNSKMCLGAEATAMPKP